MHEAASPTSEMQFVEQILSTIFSSAGLLQTCDDAQREQRVTNAQAFAVALWADYRRLTGREIEETIHIVEGDVCDYPDRFDRNMHNIWQDLQRAREIVDALDVAAATPPSTHHR